MGVGQRWRDIKRENEKYVWFEGICEKCVSERERVTCQSRRQKITRLSRRRVCSRGFLFFSAPRVRAVCARLARISLFISFLFCFIFFCCFIGSLQGKLQGESDEPPSIAFIQFCVLMKLWSLSKKLIETWIEYSSLRLFGRDWRFKFRASENQVIIRSQ